MLEDLTDAQREQAELPQECRTLRVLHVGESGPHAVATRAGFQKGDLVVAFDGQSGRMSESELLAFTVQRKRPGDVVAVTVLRDGARTTLTFALQ